MTSFGGIWPDLVRAWEERPSEFICSELKTLVEMKLKPSAGR